MHLRMRCDFWVESHGKDDEGWSGNAGFQHSVSMSLNDETIHISPKKLNADMSICPVGLENACGNVFHKTGQV